MRRFPILAAAALSMLVPAGAAAQDATPAADFVVPDPAECMVVPRTIESLIAIVTADPAATPQPLEDLTRQDVGEPADAATTAAVTAMVREAIACANSGAELSRLAFFTDAAIARFQAEDPITADQVRIFFGGTPVAAPVEQQVGVRVSDVRRLDDGRVVALAEFRYGNEIGRSYVFMIEEDGRWLVDAEIDAELDGGPATDATPGATPQATPSA
jgi:hypothetical protein